MRDLTRFSDPQDLFNYLKSTHPPQNPGGLSEADYWQVAAYLLQQAGRLKAGSLIGPASQIPTFQDEILGFIGIVTITVVLSLALIRQIDTTG